jgi:fucose permease
MLLIALAYVGFISLGMPDGLLGVAYPSMVADFGIPLETSLGVLLLAATIGYMISSFNAGRLLAWIGVGRLLAGSCALTGSALLGYSIAPEWWVMISIAVFAGFGAGAIDAGLNVYVASNYSERTMQWLHASYGIGISAGPLIMTTVLNSGASWRVGYMIVGFAQWALAACFFLTANRWKTSKKTEDGEKPAQIAPQMSTLRLPMAYIGMLLFFLYVGLEVSVGQWAFTVMTQSRGFDVTTAGTFVTLYWGSFTVGRVVGGFIANRFTTATLVRVGAVGAILGLALFILNPAQWASAVALAIVGFSIAPIFAAMTSATVERVGDAHAANAIGFQMTAMSFGIMVLPGAAGAIARATTLESIGWFALACAVGVFVLYQVVVTIQRPRSTSETPQTQSKPT